MRLAPVGVMWMSAVIVLALGCNSASSPLGTFKSFVDTEVSPLRSKYPNVPIKKFEFDVKKTDSLVSPYLGTIIIETTCPLIVDLSQELVEQMLRFEPRRKIKASIYEEDMKISLYYAWQDGKWMYKNGEFVKSNVRVLRDGSGSAEKSARNTNAEGPRSTEIKLANQLPSIFQVLDEQHAELAKILAPQVAVEKRPVIEKPKPVGKVFKSAESVTNSIGMELIGIPAGKFMMGSPAGETGRVEEREAQVSVTLTKPFGLGKYEVTQGQWKEVMGTEPWDGQKYVQADKDRSATDVSWEDAKEFCAKLTATERKSGKLKADEEYRLPTEAEWEYACRAGTTTAYSFGNNESKLGEYAWFDGNAENAAEFYAHIVGKKKPNPWGLHDMHGNVWEWCSDYDDKLSGGTDPVGPKGGSGRVLRGGSWRSGPGYCRSANRDYGVPSGRFNHLGFRVARSQSAQ